MISQTDKSLMKAALEKMNAGKTPNAREAAALKRVEKERDEARRWEHYRSVPAKHYKEMSGRPARVLIDQAEKWKIPVAGKIVDITAVVKWIHDFIADNSHRLFEDPQDSEGSKALERYRTASAEEKEMQIAVVKGQLLDRALVEGVAVVLVGRLVRCGSDLETKIGTEFALWLADPKVREMAADKRVRLVRDFVATTFRQIRDLESKDMLALIDKQRVADGAVKTEEEA